MKNYTVILFLIATCFSLKAQQVDSFKEDRFSIHAQTTIIHQYKLGFIAPYEGDNSLVGNAEGKTSITSTLFLGMRLWKGVSVFINPEIAGGSGLSQALGIAAATNGETFRVGNPAPQIYLARFYYRQVIALSKSKTYQESDFNQLGEYLPTKYLALTIGKIGIADYFDDNKFSHDPRSQFMSWALMSNGAWDYPANTRGYTPSVVVEYITPKQELRYGISLVPLSANGNDMNWKIGQASSHTIEFTQRIKIKKQPGAIRILGFFTSANMGNYRESLKDTSQIPTIESTRKFGRIKYGFALNAEQNITSDLGCFLRASWNDGNNETWMFTEIDHSISFGFSMSGTRWKRKNDQIGMAYVGSGISKPHNDYLKAGGKGFMLGDGNLNYTWEHLAELYYSLELVKKHLFISGAYQILANPGYNLDRSGPISIFSLRLHARI